MLTRFEQHDFVHRNLRKPCLRVFPQQFQQSHSGFAAHAGQRQMRVKRLLRNQPGVPHCDPQLELQGPQPLIVFGPHPHHTRMLAIRKGPQSFQADGQVLCPIRHVRQQGDQSGNLLLLHISQKIERDMPAVLGFDSLSGISLPQCTRHPPHRGQ